MTFLSNSLLLLLLYFLYSLTLGVGLLLPRELLREPCLLNVGSDEAFGLPHCPAKACFPPFFPLGFIESETARFFAKVPSGDSMVDSCVPRRNSLLPVTLSSVKHSTTASRAKTHKIKTKLAFISTMREGGSCK